MFKEFIQELTLEENKQTNNVFSLFLFLFLYVHVHESMKWKC